MPSTGWMWERSMSVAMPEQHGAQQGAQRDLRALGPSTAGSRNDGTALAIASTPVSAAQPLANALSSSSTPTVCTDRAAVPSATRRLARAPARR